MRTIPHGRLVVFAAVVTGAAVLLGLTGWPQPDRVLEFSGVILAAMLVSAVALVPSTAEDRGMMPPSFVIDFSALLLFGGSAALLVAAAGITTRWLADSDRARPLRSRLLNAATVMTAMAAASLAYGALGGVPGHFTWPWQGVPIAAAVVAYCFVKSTSAEVIAPLFNREAFNRSWPMAMLRNSPNYFLGATLAVALVEIVNRGRWDVMPVAAVPLYCAYRTYCADLHRLEHEYRCREIIESLNQGMSVIDSGGRVTLWNDDMERIMGCPRERALGRPLAGAVPALGQTQLPRAVQDAMMSRSPRTLTQVLLPSASGARILEVKILPVAGGLTLLWHDITERTHAEQALKRSEERLTLAAEGANDGLWEWDLRTQAFYVSGRWKAMIGLPATASIGRSEEWLGRVHADDVVPLKASLDAHLAGTTGHFEYEHRIRHEDGTYRRFLCRGLAARGASQRAARIAGSLTDTTEQGSAQEQLRAAGSRDPLTGLCNRAVFVERLGQRLAEFKRRKGGGDWFAVALSGPRPLQGRQRQPRSHGRRRTAHRGVAAAGIVPAAGRRARAVGR